MENSHEFSPDLPSDAVHRLPRDVYLEIMRILRVALPCPLRDEETEEDLARRNRAAMAAVARLRPQSPAEGRLAAQFVAADAWAMDCLRLAEVVSAGAVPAAPDDGRDEGADVSGDSLGPGAGRRPRGQDDGDWVPILPFHWLWGEMGLGEGGSRDCRWAHARPLTPPSPPIAGGEGKDVAV